MNPLGPDIPFRIEFFDHVAPDVRHEFPHRHSYYLLIFVEKAQGRHVIDFIPHRVQSHSIYFLSPGQVHCWQLEKAVKMYVLWFTEDFLLLYPSEQPLIHELNFIHTVAGVPHAALKPHEHGIFQGLFSQMQTEYHADRHGQATILRAYLRILLVWIQRICIARHGVQPLGKRSALVYNFKKMVLQRFKTQQSVPAYARQLGVSSSHLSDTVKTVTGLSPGQIIRNEIAFEAKRLLVHTELTATQVGYRLNFDDSSYFGRFFKRETGKSPTAYRVHIREKYQIFPQ